MEYCQARFYLFFFYFGKAYKFGYLPIKTPNLYRGYRQESLFFFLMKRMFNQLTRACISASSHRI